MSRPEISKHLEALEHRRQELVEEIRETNKEIGSVDGPMQSWRSHVKEDLQDKAMMLGKSLERTEALIEDLSNLGVSERGNAVIMGSRVRLLFDGEEREFLITKTQSDPAKGILSLKTSLGEAVLGRKQGESFTIALPKRELSVEILEIL